MTNDAQQLAKKLLDYRLECELNFSNDIKRKVIEVFKELCLYGYNGSLTPLDFQFNKLPSKREVDNVISSMCKWIYERQIDYCNDVIENVAESYGIEPQITADEYINDYEYGHTDKERIRIYANRFKYEAEAWIAAAMVTGNTMATLVNSFSEDMQNPYNNTLFNQAVKIRSMSATRLKTKGKSYGVGRYVSSFNAIKRLCRAVVADSSKRSHILTYKAIGARGFIVYRGSSYPCSLCDSMVGYYDISAADGMPPYHCNCVCYTVPVLNS